MPRLKITKTGRRLIYLGVAAYLVFLLHALPASFLTHYILPAMPAARSVKLQGVHGSIWQGQASDARFANFNLGKLDWHVRSWGLLLGKLKLHLKFNQDSMHGAAYVDLGLGGSVTAEDVNMQFPAQNLSGGAFARVNLTKAAGDPHERGAANSLGSATSYRLVYRGEYSIFYQGKQNLPIGR